MPMLLARTRIIIFTTVDCENDDSYVQSTPSMMLLKLEDFSLGQGSLISSANVSMPYL